MKSGIDVVLSSEQISDLKDAFHALDTEGEGQIDLRDLKVAIRALGFEVQKDEISKILNELDRMAADESRPPRIPNGRISLEIFVDFMKYKMAQEDPADIVKEAFQLFADSSGHASFESIRKVAWEVGMTLSDEELKEMVTEADLDGDGLISEKEFVGIILS